MSVRPFEQSGRWKREYFLMALEKKCATVQIFRDIFKHRAGARGKVMQQLLNSSIV